MSAPRQMTQVPPDPADGKAERRDGNDTGKAKKPKEAPEKPKEGKTQPPKGAMVAEEMRLTLDRNQGDGPPNAMRIRAREVTKGGKTLTLLNDDGTPAWRPGGPPMPANTTGKTEQ